MADALRDGAALGLILGVALALMTGTMGAMLWGLGLGVLCTLPLHPSARRRRRGRRRR